MKRKKIHWNAIALIVLVLIVGIGSFFIDLEVLKRIIEGAGVWAPILYIIAKMSVVVFAPLSGIALYVFSVPLFGFWNGLLYSFIGDLIGATITFYLSKFFGKPVVEYFAGKSNMKYIDAALNTLSNKKGFFSLRLATITTPEIASYAAGLTKLRFVDFIFIHMAVDLIPIIVMTVPGLIFAQELPVWISVALISVAVIVSIVSFIFFLRMIKKEAAKNSLLID